MIETNNTMSTQNKKKTENTAYWVGCLTVLIVVVLIVIKAHAYHTSGSVSVLSSLIDSILDSAISVMALASLYYARRPADEDHRWGHGKMEAVSALFQAAIITGAAAFILFEALQHIAQPEAITHHKTAVIVMWISVILSGVLVLMQRLSLKRSESLAIEADSIHYSSDIIINLGALAVLYLNWIGYTPHWIDPLFGLCVSGLMIALVRQIAKKSLDILLDRELPEQERQKLIDIIEAHKKVSGWHDLRTHKHGSYAVISFDIEVDPDLSLWIAHSITKDLEEAMLKLYPQADILIHVDPEGYIEDARHKVKGVHI